MNDDDLGWRVAAQLNRAADALPAGVVSALRQARVTAAGRPRGAAMSSSSSAFSLAGQRFSVRFAVPVFVLMIGLFGVALWQIAGPQPIDHAETDAALLSDELPITAYLDSGFDSWLEETAQD